jgi:hypothetical protein
MPILLLVVVMMCSTVIARAEGPAGSNSAQANVVKGDVLYWEGDELVMKDILGKEIRLHVNSNTKIEGVAGKLKTGDKIEATVTAEGQAGTIRLQTPDAAAAGPR